MLDLEQFVGFDWDEGNQAKNWTKHRVANEECEQIFFNEPVLIFFDAVHSEGEERYYVLGKTDAGRRLFVVCTPRDNLLRVISARDMTKAERRRYDG